MQGLIYKKYKGHVSKEYKCIIRLLPYTLLPYHSVCKENILLTKLYNVLPHGHSDEIWVQEAALNQQQDH